MKRLNIAGAMTLALASCTSHQAIAKPPRQPISAPPIHVQSGAPQYVFQPVDVPSGSAAPEFTARQAYNKMFGKAEHAPVTIPTSTKVRYGLLSEDDTIPPAHRLPVWAFADRGGCLNTMPVPVPGTTPPTPDEPPSRCVRWQFASAATGKDLEVVDQENLS